MFVPCIEWCRASSFNRWPFPLICRAIGLVSSAKPMLRLIFVCLGRGLLPPPGPDTFYEICKAARLFLPANQHPGLFMFFPFYAEAGLYCPPPLFLHFALYFCSLIFAFLFASLSAIFKFNHLRGYLSKKIPKS